MEKKNYKGLFFILGLTFFLYLEPVLKSEFLNWDDGLYLTSNEEIKRKDGFYQIWFEKSMPNPYPLTFSVIRLLYMGFGENSPVFHLVNLSLHCCNIFLFWLIMNRLGLSAVSSFFALSLYALHPVQVETVMWMSEIKNLLCAFFYWLSFLAFLRFQEAQGKSKYFAYLLMCIAFLFSLLSKSTSVTLPVTFVLWLLLFRTNKFRFHLFLILPLFGASLFFGMLSIENEAKFHEKRARPGSEIATKNISEKFSTAINAYVFYSTKFFWPQTLSCIYPSTWFLPDGKWEKRMLVLLFFLFVAFLFYQGWKSKEKEARLFFFCLLNYGLVASPTSGFFYTSYLGISFFADRYNYHPLPFLLIAFGLAVSLLWKKLPKKGKEWTGIFFGVVLFFLVFQTYSYAFVWTNSIRLWSHAYQVDPSHPITGLNLGRSYHQAGELEKAEYVYEVAAKHNPSFDRVLVNYGVLMQQIGQYEKALDLFFQAHYARADKREPLLNIGALYLYLGDVEKAISYLERSVKFGKAPEGAYLALASAYFEAKEYEKAKEFFQKSLEEQFMPERCLSQLALIEQKEKEKKKEKE